MRGKISTLLTFLLAAVFAYAGISKILDPVTFSGDIQRYNIIGHPLSLIAALWIPWVEVLASVGLILKKWRPSALALLAVLLLVFEVILISAYIRDLDIECGCFGKFGGQNVTIAFLRNIFLLGALAYVGWARKNDHECAK